MNPWLVGFTLIILFGFQRIWVFEYQTWELVVIFSKDGKNRHHQEKEKWQKHDVFTLHIMAKKIVIVGLKIQIGRDVSCYWNEGILPDKSLGYSPKRLALNTEYLKFFWRIVRNCFKVCLIVKFATIVNGFSVLGGGAEMEPFVF